MLRNVAGIGNKQHMKTKMITKAILTVLTLALGIRPRDEALLVSSSLPLLFPAALEAAAQLVIAKVRSIRVYPKCCYSTFIH